MRKIIVFILMLLCLFGFSLSTNSVVTAAVSSTYYAGTENLTGDDLLDKLATISQQKHKTFTSYSDLTTMNHKTDPDPKNSSNLLDFYSRISVKAKWDSGSTWNREHIWPQSLSGGLFGTSGAGSDIHHIRPTIPSINSARNNSQFTDFDMVNKTGKEYKYNGVLAAYHIGQDYWEPLDNVKGDVARILMYMYMHYSKEVKANASYNKAGNLKITSVVYGGGDTQKAWDILLYWNDLDPVDDYEANRNEYCAQVTGVRNPFIDNMNFCDAIWGEVETVSFEDTFKNLNIKSQIVFDVDANGDDVVVDYESLRLRYVLQLNEQQYKSYLPVASNVKMYVNNEEVTYSVVDVDDEYRLIYSIDALDYSQVYTPKFTYGSSTITISGYSIKSLAQYYLNNLSNDTLVKQYGDCLTEIAK